MIDPIPGRVAAALLAGCLLLAACGGGGPPRRSAPLTPTAAPTGSTEAVRFYHSMGLAAAAAPVPFVGSAAHFAGASPDRAHTLVTLSIPNRGLTFTREADRYRAHYAVDLRVLRDGSEVERIEALEFVRVASFRETGRTDESLIFQRWLRLAPGSYTIRLAVRDVGSGSMSGDTLVTTVPYFTVGSGISTPLPVYEARSRTTLDSMPSLLARPRATAVFGRDSLVAIYVEGYSGTGAARLPVAVAVRNDAGVTVWTDTASLAGTGSLYSGTLRVPIARVGMGVGFVSVVPAGSADTARTPYFVSFGEDLPVAPFDEMLSYLRFFASSPRLSALRNAPAERRAQLWADFLRETDPVANTPEHEGLQSYFGRIQFANARFRDDLPPGWLSDRGNVYVALGDPDNIFEQTLTVSGGRRLPSPVRVQVWEYRQLRAQFMFTDEQQTGRFQFARRSESEFRAVLQRVLSER